MKALILSVLTEFAAVGGAIIVWWIILVCLSLGFWLLMGMPPSVLLMSPDDSVFEIGVLVKRVGSGWALRGYIPGFFLQAWELPGFFLGFILALYTYRFVFRSLKRGDSKIDEVDVGQPG